MRRRRVGDDGGRQTCRCLILPHIARVEPRHRHRGDPGARDLGQIGHRQHPALRHLSPPKLHRMRQHRALGLIHGKRAEPHQPCLNTCVISAMIDSAISAGLFAPMFRPTGAWILAISLAVNPASSSRATRLAWVRVDPRQPR